MYKNNQNIEKILNTSMEDMTVEKLFSDVTDLLRELVVIAFTLKLEMALEDYDGEDEQPVMVMTIDPTGSIDICTQEEGDELFDDGDSLEDVMVFDDLLILTCESSRIVELDGVRYLLGTAVIREIDEDGNDCSIDDETIRDAFDYIETNLTGITVDGKEIPAFRLVE